MQNQMNPVGWFEIYVQDMKRAKAFYQAVLGTTLEALADPGGGNPSLEMWAFPMSMEKTGASGALVKMDGFPSGGNSTLVYFSCSDCAVEAARVKSNGGQVHQEKMAIGQHGFIALCVDTESNMFGLHSMS